MNKRALIEKIVKQLTSDLEGYLRAARAAHAEATHEQSRAENKYDTRGLEASYLARGQSKQAAEIEAAIEAFGKLDGRVFAPGEPVDLGALVELEGAGERTIYFIGPKAGGTEVMHQKREVLVITPASPLGEQLMGRKQGESLQMKIAGATNKYLVASVE
jgi:transcription elongation GreA/GreB family factor